MWGWLRHARKVLSALAAIREVLQMLEWVQDFDAEDVEKAGREYCLVCQRQKDVGHSVGCKLDAVLDVIGR